MSTSITEEKRKLLMGKTVEDISEWMEGTLGKKPVPAKKKRRLYAFRSAYKSLHGKLKKNEGNDSYSLLSKINLLEKRKIKEGHPEKSVKGYSWIVRRTLAQYADHLSRAAKKGGVEHRPDDDVYIDMSLPGESVVLSDNRTDMMPGVYGLEAAVQCSNAFAGQSRESLPHVHVSMTAVERAALQVIAAQDGKAPEAWCGEKLSEAIIVALNSMGEV